jgi:NAD(P)H-dependent flavin oxidoreductase YrpB (nitropropane dioxygenase family)
MTLPAEIRSRLTIPAVCAPMATVSGPRLAIEACKAGLMAGLPPGDAGSFDDLEAWMMQIDAELTPHAADHPDRPIGPFAINLQLSKSDEEIKREMEVAGRCGVKVFITAKGDPAGMVKRVHDYGGLLSHDIVNLKHAAAPQGPGSAEPSPGAVAVQDRQLPSGVQPWRDLWSAGQGIELIDDIPTVAEPVRRLRLEYVAACRTPDMVEAASARLADKVMNLGAA